MLFLRSHFLVSSIFLALILFGLLIGFGCGDTENLFKPAPAGSDLPHDLGNYLSFVSPEKSVSYDLWPTPKNPLFTSSATEPYRHGKLVPNTPTVIDNIEPMGSEWYFIVNFDDGTKHEQTINFNK